MNDNMLKAVKDYEALQARIQGLLDEWRGLKPHPGGVVLMACRFAGIAVTEEEAARLTALALIGGLE